MEGRKEGNKEKDTTHRIEGKILMKKELLKITTRVTKNILHKMQLTVEYRCQHSTATTPTWSYWTTSGSLFSNNTSYGHADCFAYFSLRW